MRSATVLDPSSVAGAPEVRDLLVLWQHPQTRAIVPIGRFAKDGTEFTFVYTRAATAVQGFRPLPGFGDLHRRYVSDRIPPVFGQRVMDPDRPDYVEYLGSLGLAPAHATPWEQIVRSGGTRVGDTLQFMQVPTVIDGRARTRFLANGVRHIPDAERTVGGRITRVSPERHEAVLRSLSPGAPVLVESEDGNVQDSCASLVTSDDVPLGYVPRVLSTSIRELMSSGPVRPTVVRVGAPGTPPHLRLVLDLDVPAPSGFQFDHDGLWEPVHA